MTPTLLKRALSGLYELLLLAGLTVLAGFLMVPLGQGLDLSPQHATLFTRLWASVLISGYFVWFWTHGGQTLPMKTWRIRLVKKNGDGVGFSLALMRLLLLAAGFGLGGIHLLWALIDQDRQFLHDRMLGTRLIQVEAS